MTVTNIACAILLAVLVKSSGICPAGYKRKPILTNTFCTSSATTGTSCSPCCIVDTQTCRHYTQSISCAVPNSIVDPAKYGQTVATNGADKNVVCCTAKSACSAGNCSAGYQMKASVAGLYCSSIATTAASCNANCCDLQANSCLAYSNSVSCAANYFKDPAKYGATVSAGGTDKNTVCCTEKATCLSGSCLTGYQKKSNVTNMYCDSDSTAASCNANCCDLLVNTCMAHKITWGITCAADRYEDSSKHAHQVTAVFSGNATAGNNKNTVCCTQKLSCMNAFMTTTTAACHHCWVANAAFLNCQPTMFLLVTACLAAAKFLM